MTRTTVIDRPISVHVLAEYTFCRCAGFNAYLDNGLVDRPPSIQRLNYQPCYDSEELTRGLNRLAQSLWLTGLTTAALFLVGLLLGRWWNWTFYIGGFGATFFVGSLLVRDLIEAWHLTRDYNESRSKLALEPKADLPRDETINWWSMRAAGFVPQTCSEISDRELNLTGSPWRVLRRGNLAIPVFVRQQSDGEIHDQQRVRIEAYCHLLRVNERAESPYGIVLDKGTFEGTAIKTSEKSFARIRNQLAVFENMLTTFLRHSREPTLPVVTRICSGCMHGKPRRYQAGGSETYSDGEPIYPRTARAANGMLYHSSCGDRFDWIPPHNSAIELAIR